MKTIIMILLISTQSFAKATANTVCPEGETLERFSQSLTDVNGSILEQDVYVCVKLVNPCEEVIQYVSTLSSSSGSKYTIEEGFKCGSNSLQQCQQQQQQQPQNHCGRAPRVRTIRAARSYQNKLYISSGEFIKFNNKIYRCL